LFHRAQQLTPQYSVLLINLAIAEDATNQSAAAEQHFKDALRLAPTSPDSYTYYARYLLSHSRAQEARASLRSALELSPTDLTARELLAQADAQAVNQPATQTPEYYLDLSLQHYREGRYVESVAASRTALKLTDTQSMEQHRSGLQQTRPIREGKLPPPVSACPKPDFNWPRNNLQLAREMAKTSGK
jgi:tetratricopeptide (TPR) repeat protein